MAADPGRQRKPAPDAPPAERRRHRRYAVTGATVLARTQGEHYPLLNVSAGGLAFRSERAFAVGQHLTLALLDYVAVDAEVVGCEMIEVDADLMEYAYRVRCRIQEEDHARLLLQFTVGPEALEDEGL